MQYRKNASLIKNIIALILSALFVIVYGSFLSVVVEFEELFKEMKIDLPALTHGLLTFHYTFLIFVGLCLIGVYLILADKRKGWLCIGGAYWALIIFIAFSVWVLYLPAIKI